MCSMATTAAEASTLLLTAPAFIADGALATVSEVRDIAPILKSELDGINNAA